LSFWSTYPVQYKSSSVILMVKKFPSPPKIFYWIHCFGGTVFRPHATHRARGQHRPPQSPVAACCQP
jgi:hypothetical protein